MNKRSLPILLSTYLLVSLVHGAAPPVSLSTKPINARLGWNLTPLRHKDQPSSTDHLRRQTAGLPCPPSCQCSASFIRSKMTGGHGRTDAGVPARSGYGRSGQPGATPP